MLRQSSRSLYTIRHFNKRCPTFNNSHLSSSVYNNHATKNSIPTLRYASTINFSSPSARILTPHKINTRLFSDLPPHRKVNLPVLSPTMETGNLVSWMLNEGDKINEGDVLAEVETDKAVMEFACPEHIAEGYLAKIITPAGTKEIKLGELICIIVDKEEDLAAFVDFKLAPSPADTPIAPPTSADPVVESTPSIPPLSQETTSPSKTSRIIASPYAKKIASEQGVSITSLRGSGSRGRIISSDVLQASSSPQTTPLEYTGTITAVTPPSYTDIELSNMRKTIAKRLTQSKQNIPHYYLQTDINMDEIIKLRQSTNSRNTIGPKLSLNDYIIKATACALQEVRECNASFMETFIRQNHNIDISIAVATSDGLITPIIFTADKKGLKEINYDVTRLAEKARTGKLQPHEFQGGTFTISNLGMYGIKSFSAVINPPQSCILAIAATEERTIPDTNGYKDFTTANFLSATLSCDHRVVDGAIGAKWMSELKRLLENPGSMLLY